MLRMILCDWNGTLFRDTLEEAYFVGLCRRAVFRAARRGRLGRLARLTAAGARCYLQYAAARLRPSETMPRIGRIIELLNPVVFRGLTAGELAAYDAEYARRVQPKLDRRLLDPLWATHRRCGAEMGVLSAGCRAGIAAALRAAGCEVNLILANEFRMDGDVVAGFDFALTSNKADALEALLAERGVAPEDVLYVGDGEHDEQCLRLVGYPVVSFYATRTARRQLTENCGAFAPTTREQLERHLARVAGE